MSKNKRGLGTPEEIGARSINAHTSTTVVAGAPRLNRGVRKATIRSRNELQALVNKELFEHRHILNIQLAEGKINKHEHKKLQKRQFIVPVETNFPTEAYFVPIQKKEGKIRPSRLGMREKARNGARETSEVNRLARIERRRKWELMNAEVMAQLAV